MKKLLLCIIKFYQFFISPLLGTNCKFYPSCSDYAKDSIIRHGCIKGIWFAGCRIIRCQPFSKGGHDPVYSSENDKNDYNE